MAAAAVTEAVTAVAMEEADTGTAGAVTEAVATAEEVAAAGEPAVRQAP
jgi:hypothetical protein